MFSDTHPVKEFLASFFEPLLADPAKELDLFETPPAPAPQQVIRERLWLNLFDPALLFLAVSFHFSSRSRRNRVCKINTWRSRRSTLLVSSMRTLSLSPSRYLFQISASVRQIELCHTVCRFTREEEQWLALREKLAPSPPKREVCSILLPLPSRPLFLFLSLSFFFFPRLWISIGTEAASKCLHPRPRSRE